MILMEFDQKGPGKGTLTTPSPDSATPGKRTLTEGLPPGRSPLAAVMDRAHEVESPSEIAEQGVSGSSDEVPYRAEMETAFGTSFDDVRVFRGPEAQQAAVRLKANAYVLNNKIAFADPSPSKELVAHELTHIVQQRGGRATGIQKKDVSAPGDAHEIEADRVGAQVASGDRAPDVKESNSAQISRSAWDIAGAIVYQGHAPTIKKGLQKAAKENPLFRDMLDSIAQAPIHGASVLAPIAADLKKHWPQFVQQAATIIAAEVAVAALVGAPDPTLGTKFIALLLQALLIALAFYAAYETTKKAIDAGRLWWELIIQAKGNPLVIEPASAAFAVFVFEIVSALLAAGALIASAGAGFRVPGRELSRPKKATPTAEEAGKRAGDRCAAFERLRRRFGTNTKVDFRRHCAYGSTPKLQERHQQSRGTRFQSRNPRRCNTEGSAHRSEIANWCTTSGGEGRAPTTKHALPRLRARSRARRSDPAFRWPLLHGAKD